MKCCSGLALLGLLTTVFPLRASAFSPQEWVQPLTHCQDFQGRCLAIDISDRTVTLFQKGKEVNRYPVAVGKTGWETPLGNHYIFEMGRDVDWIDLFTGELSEHNPMLGSWIGYARFEDDIRVGFHPTPNRNSVGQAASHGCNRMTVEDFDQLYQFIEEAKSVVPVLVRT